MAAMVLSKEGGVGSAAMRSISARFSAIADSSAGFKPAGVNRPKGGTPPQGPDQGASSRFTWATAVLSPEMERGEASSGLVGCAAQPARAASTGASAAVVRRGAGKVMFHPWRGCRADPIPYGVRLGGFQVRLQTP